MTQIKSKKALIYLESNEYTVSHKYGDEIPCIDPEDARQAIIIAETEAEELHAKKLQEFKDKLDCDKYHLENNPQIEMHEVRDKCFSDIKEFTSKWEASDRKMDEFHLKEVKRLKNYIESILLEIARAGHLNEVKRFVELNKPLSDILISKNN